MLRVNSYIGDYIIKQNDIANEGLTYLGVPAGEGVSVGMPFMLYLL